MKDDGDTKDDVKVPEGDVGKKIKDAFEGDKTTSMSMNHPHSH